MKSVVATACLLAFLIGICPVYQKQLNKERDRLIAGSLMGYYIPSKVTGLASLDFKGIVSDFLFLKISTFLGGKLINKEVMNETHGEFIFNAVDIITDLDPWFWDAYLLAEMVLAWDFKRIELANKLLLKARSHRTWDFKPSYYLGFNHFYFLKDNAKGSTYLMEAANLPGSPKYLPGLATRLSIYQNRFEPAIAFLDELIKNTHNPTLVQQLKTRLETIIILDSLGKKVVEFKNMFGFFPKTIDDLLREDILEKRPEDPYGGEFIILKNGRVFTTSRMRFNRKKDQP